MRKGKVFALVFFAVILSGKVFAAYCSSYSWAPSTVYPPSYTNSGSSIKYSYQQFKWNTTAASAFNTLGAHYQYEVRRNINKWNFFTNYPWEGVYWTNLPNTSQLWSEESGTLFGPDEEMEIKSYNTGVSPNVLYYVQAKYARLSPSVTMNVQTESEYCGSSFPFCNVGTQFGWCTMNSSNLAS